MDAVKRKEFLNLPNYISLIRILAVPLIVILMMCINDNTVHQKWNILLSFIVALIYGVASASDMVDGFIARRYKLEGNFGKFFDPLADKLLSLAAMIMLIPLHRIPAWLVVLLLVREIVITMLRGVAVNERIVIPASKWGKYKNAFGSFGVAFLILHYSHFGINWLLVGWVLFLVSATFSIGSSVHYIHRFIEELSKKNS
ncbi:MAG: CDP-diacylglycerol--glycerol-3-phosphate 3-phosphatidyltransferase [Deltaproteobacteria bacterium CG11_big_fil_rev_8_21_14_0_20_49_13]|nr:MAG: CDP-diacylglycerol--glycerol-3-phosphate 3-phosphatidyltransferase [Deltaproteobacteria bacterium CG11_big_fil_rev_8_21_14_0_20_49_13]